VILRQLIILSLLLGACSTTEPRLPAAPGDPDDTTSSDSDTPILPDVVDSGPADVPESETDVDADAADDGDPPPKDTGDNDGCQPDCANKDCGADGCGGLCGFCAVGLKCNNLSQCGPDCDPKCDGKFCGPDGCGGACGTCPDNFECGADGKCYDVTCVPECAGKVCGDDGCGGDCGLCVEGDLCVDGACVIGPCSGVPENGKCEDGVALLCVDGELALDNCLLEDGKECGWSPELGHYACVEEVICEPVCTGKQCGSDGCGGQCGACPIGWPCTASQCEPTEGGACGFFNAVGKCIDNVLWYCSEGTLLSIDCTIPNKTCGFSPQAQANTCLDSP